MSGFILHPRLAADTAEVLEWPLSRVLLMNDSRFPWVILVPRRDEVRELYELSAVDQSQFLTESIVLGRTLMQHFLGHKLNVAALGNLVPQLHIHHIVRFEHDACWPKPVFGQGVAEPYAPEALAIRLEELRVMLRHALEPRRT